MNHAHTIAFACIAAVASQVATPAAAEQRLDGSRQAEASAQGSLTLRTRPSGEQSRSVDGLSRSRSATRTKPAEPASAAEAFTLIGRTKSGEDLRIEPDAELLRSLEAAPPSGERQGAVEGGTERAVVGRDNRQRVTTSTDAPFAWIGYAQHSNGKDLWGGCTGTLISSRHVLTAAGCLYDLARGTWLEDFAFYPGLNGENDAPYGGWDWQSVYVFNGFVSEFDGTYDSVWPYDYGVIELAEPLGDQIGWMGVWNKAEMDGIKIEMAGYHDDTEPFTLWRTACEIRVGEAFESDFLHECDTSTAAYGAPIYQFDPTDDGYWVIGMHMGDYGEANWGLRMTDPAVQWLARILNGEI